MLTKRHLLLAVATCALLYLANLHARRLTPAFASLGATATGSFTEGSGWYPGEPFAHAVNLRAWGSWSGGDENRGTLRIGPFPAPRVLHFGLGGYLTTAGNRLHLERADTRERRRIEYPPVGERWAVCDVEVPAGWEGKPVELVAEDGATALGGWFALTEPLRGGRSDGNHALLDTFTAWAINGLLLGLPLLAAARGILRRGWIEAPWAPLAGGALLALGGYITYGCFLVHPWLGWAAAGLILAAAGWELRRPAASGEAANADAREISIVLGLMLAVGAFHLALLHLFPTSHDFYTLAANRFRENLPGDNTLPHMYAERLFAGQSPKDPADGWQSSDRPPLQIGWQLLTWPASKLLQLDRRTASGTSGVWFQLLWVAAAYALLRTFRLPPRRAAAWVAALGLAGFFVQNTTFTWPKLSAGAFACGTFAALLLPFTPGNWLTRGLWAALFGGLAWLSHGGVAFSFLPLVPWVIWRAVRGAWCQWLPGAALFAAIVLPWVAYQKFYDPPGNLLLKLHFAGVEQQDGRGLGETLRTAYAQLGWEKALANRISNFHSQVYGDWRALLDVGPERQVERRNHEFFHTGRGLTWWPVLAFIGVVLAGRRVFAPPRDLLVLAGWILATIAGWCLLMFGTYTASIHHGSYAVMLALFTLFSVLLERAGRGWLILIAGLQAVTLGTNWAVANAAIQGAPAGLPWVIAAALPLAWFLLRGFLRPGQAAGAPAATPAAADPAPAAPPGTLRAWWARPRVTFWAVAALAVLCFARKPHAFHTPQLWAEDGSIFLVEADLHGLESVLRPYAGYLHTVPRLIALATSVTVDPAWWPACYNGVAILLWIAVIARLFSARLDLPHKPWIALAVVLIPHSGEVYFNVTNLQWILGLALVQLALLAPPLNARQRAGDLLVAALVALTGPFGIVLLPLFAWRWWRQRRADAALLFGVVAVCAALQAWCIVRTGQRFDFQSAPLQLWPNVVVVARRLVLWTVLGRDLALSLPPALIGAVGGGLMLGLTAVALRPHPRRALRVQILGAFGLVLLAGIYRIRPDTWAADNLDYGDRYFFLPRVLLAWLVIWEIDAASRIVSRLARLAIALTLLFHVNDLVLRAPKDYEWRKHVEPIRRGIPAEIPTLPEGWTLEYRGRRVPS